MSLYFFPYCSDYLFKLLLIGDSGVGKSCLLLRFAVSMRVTYIHNVAKLFFSFFLFKFFSRICFWTNDQVVFLGQQSSKLASYLLHCSLI